MVDSDTHVTFEVSSVRCIHIHTSKSTNHVTLCVVSRAILIFLRVCASA